MKLNKAQGESLSVINTKHRKVTTDLVLSAAQDERHPLHSRFTWDDTEAARKCRIEEARQIIAAWKTIVLCQVSRNAKPTEVRVRQLLPSFKQSATYTIRAKVLEKEDTRGAFVRQKIAALQDWCNSVSDVTQLDEMRWMIQAALDKMD